MSDEPKGSWTGSPSASETDFIPWGRPDVSELEVEYAADAVRSGWLSGGEYVQRFEDEFAAYVGREHALAASSGTAALHLCLTALGVGPGDEVLVPGYTFAATGNSVLFCGARPVFVDVDPDGWLLDLKKAEEAVASRTKALIVVHLHGAMPDMDEVLAFCRRHGLGLVEDTAQGLGSTCRGRRAGSFGDMAAFSLQATKTMTTGEGGVVVTDDAALAARVRLYREHGLRERGRYYHEVVGFNYRLTNVQAAVGCAQLERLDGLVESRRRAAAAYRTEVARLGLGRCQTVRPCVEASPFSFALLPDFVSDGAGRDEVLGALETRGIEGRPGWCAASRLPVYEAGSLPVSESVAERAVLLPLYSGLGEDEVKRVCRALAEIRAEGGADG